MDVIFSVCDYVKVDFYVIANCLLLRRMFVTKKLKEGSKTLGFRPTSNFHFSAIARAFDEFKIRWIPPVQLVYPEPAGFYFLGCSLTKKKTADPLASMLAD